MSDNKNKFEDLQSLYELGKFEELKSESLKLIAINENNIVGDIKKQISDLTDKIGSEVKRAITGKNKLGI